MDEASASTLARSSGTEVAVDGATTSSSRTVALPDGSFRLEVTSGPTRVRRPGGWVDIDTTLVKSGGALRPRATAADLTLGSGGSAPFALLRSGASAYGLSWPATLPEPVVRGDTATYRGVRLPSGQPADLAVTALKTGFAHTVVLRDRPARPVEIRLPIVSEGGVRLTLDARTGSLQLRDPAGRLVASAPAPQMWDSSSDADGDSDTVRVDAAVEDTAGGQALVLRPDMGFLTSPDRRYPVTIDPTTSLYAATDVWTDSDSSVTRQGSDVLKAGHKAESRRCPDGCTARSYLKFASSSLVGTRILDADLWLYSWRASSCTEGAGLEVSRVTGEWDPATLTWSTQPPVTSADAVTNRERHGHSAACPADYMSWDIDSIVSAWAAGAPDNGLRLAAADESDPDSWAKFYSANKYSGADAREPRLIVTYQNPPAAPSAADLSSDPGGACATDASAPALSATATPTLTAVLRDPDNRVGGTIEWWDGQSRKGGRDIAPITNSGVSSGLPFSATVPSGAFADGQTIAWRARSSDENATSDWSGWCYLKISSGAPLPPVVSSADYPADGQAHGGVGKPGAFTFSAGSPDVVSYEYTFEGQAPVTESVAPGESLTIAWAPTSDGTQRLGVRNRNAAGRWSSRVTYRFSVAVDGGTGGGEAMLSSYWPFDGGSGSIAANAVPGAPDMTLRSGATWQPSFADGGLGGRMGASDLLVDAQSGGYADTPSGVVSTRGSYSVMAWVKPAVVPETPDDRMVVVSQFGEANTGFSIEERMSPDDPAPIARWALVTSGGDSDERVVVWSSDPVDPWSWAHLTAVYDAASHTARLYVDGNCSEAVPGVGPIAGCPPIDAPDMIDATGPVNVGRGQTGSEPGWYFSGDIDEVRLYDGVVSETEIAQRQLF
ncbi:hypothetical protein GCM10023194_16130 [Planotetraspora phitsanulokensis]|uniref:LamG-like jellyroll fold domain-containing protein n=2 Tax=Planotetraspora phitsanulokensis TaxID=575192 RepID=A0A8J3UH49_9ACTN|nr:hypothetical protein Pph01_37780 [Planotetraspora phitsanulokensis]